MAQKLNMHRGGYYYCYDFASQKVNATTTKTKIHNEKKKGLDKGKKDEQGRRCIFLFPPFFRGKIAIFEKAAKVIEGLLLLSFFFLFGVGFQFLTVARLLFFASFVFTTVIGFIYCALHTCVRVFVCISLFVWAQAQPAFDLRFAIVCKNAKTEKIFRKAENAARFFGCHTAVFAKIAPSAYYANAKTVSTLSTALFALYTSSKDILLNNFHVMWPSL